MVSQDKMQWHRECTGKISYKSDLKPPVVPSRNNFRLSWVEGGQHQTAVVSSKNTSLVSHSHLASLIEKPEDYARKIDKGIILGNRCTARYLIALFSSFNLILLNASFRCSQTKTTSLFCRFRAAATRRKWIREQRRVKYKSDFSSPRG